MLPPDAVEAAAEQLEAALTAVGTMTTGLVTWEQLATLTLAAAADVLRAQEREEIIKIVEEVYDRNNCWECGVSALWDAMEAIKAKGQEKITDEAHPSNPPH